MGVALESYRINLLYDLSWRAKRAMSKVHTTLSLPPLAPPIFLANERYEILEKIGEGNFGQVFKGRVTKGRRKGELVAIKLDFQELPPEPVDGSAASPPPPLSNIAHEAKILNYLNRSSQIDNENSPIATLYWYGVIKSAEEEDNDSKDHDGEPPIMRMTMIVTTYFDMTLTKYLEEVFLGTGVCDTLFLKTIIMPQMIVALHHIHDLYVIHRDIKPSNFMISIGGCGGTIPRVRVIDFGMATFYKDGNGKHIAPKQKMDSIVGSPNYCSIFIHQGWTNSRRDDFISMLYVILHYMMNTLPWEGVPSNQEKMARKMSIVCNDPYMMSMIQTCYQMKFEDTFSH